MFLSTVDHQEEVTGDDIIFCVLYLHTYQNSSVFMSTKKN